ncbi:hypothetical protein IGI04_006103 [Brassica rapa subsp. trilocularis]|uniref:Uncharacterized protein n=1 Tax=Brassica rapa subsp. trilocularis TaxID=1813537 RepID=A0ABQ7NJ48_BRACM|nr:hypothetical protein IGI04_006103 [Brassica rapa subsp. trilocularis]
MGACQHTHDVCVCPSAHTGRQWLSVCVRQHTQDVRGCPCVSVSTLRTFVAVRVCSSAHTGRHWLSVCVRVCPSAHTGRPWLSISTHIRTLFLGLSTLTLPVDCSGDFGPRGLSIQYTQDVRGCLSVHTGCPWVSAITHRTSVAVRVCPSPHTGRPWLSISTHISMLVHRLSTLAHPVNCLGDFRQRGLSVQYTQDIRGCPPAHTGRLGISVAVRQHTQDIRGCPSVQISARCTHTMSVAVRQHTHDVSGCPCVSVCGRVCPSAHTGRLWLSISTHISTLVLGLSTLALPVDCSGDFGPHELSVQYTELHTGHPWVTASTHRTSVAVCHHTQDVRGCPPAHTGRPWLLVAVREHTQDVRVCSSAHTGPHTGRPWLSVCVRQHTQDVCACPSVHISTRWSLDSARWPFPWTVRVILAHVGCLFSIHGTSMGVRQHTQDVCVCPSAHTERSWLSVCVRVCPSAHKGCPWLSIITHISTLVLGLSTLTQTVDCSGDFGPHELYFQYTQDVCGCPSANTGRPWLFPCCGRQHTQTFRGCPAVNISAAGSLETQHAGPFRRLFGLFGPHWLCLFSVHKRSWVSFSNTHEVCVCPSAHTNVSGLSVFVPSAHTDGCGSLGVSVSTIGRSWLSCVFLSRTHRNVRAVRGCSVCCPVSTHRRPWPVHSVHISARWPLDSARGPLPLTARGILAHVGCLFSTHRTSVGVPVQVHISAKLSLDSARWTFPWTVRGVILAHVGCLFSTHRTFVGVRQHTQDVRGYPCVSVCSVHTGRLWVSVSTHRTSVAIRVFPSAHTGLSWLSISTHISTLVLGLSTLTLPVDCSGYFGPRGLSVQYTQDVCGCPSAHTGRPLSTLSHLVDCLRDFRQRGLSVQYTQDIHGCPTSVAIRGCPSAHTRHPWLSIIHTGCPWLSVSTHMTSVAFRVWPCASVSTHKTSVAVHQYTYQHAGPWTQHAGPSRGLFGTHRTSVAVRVCLSAHTGRPSLSISTHQHVVHTGRPWVTASTHRTSVAVCHHTQDVRGCPPAHTGQPWLSVAVREHTQDVRVCSSAHTGRLWQFVCVRVCPLAHTGLHTGRPWLSVSTQMTSVAVRVCPSVSVAVHQYTYQHVGPWTQLKTRQGIVTPPILNRIVGTAMVRGNMQASLRTSRQAFHGRERSWTKWTSSSASSMKLGSVHTSSVPTKSAPLAGLLAHSAEAAESQLISARRTVRALGRWSGSGSVAGCEVRP